MIKSMVRKGKFHRFVPRNNMKLILNLKIVCRSEHEILIFKNAFSDRATILYVLPTKMHDAMKEMEKKDVRQRTGFFFRWLFRIRPFLYFIHNMNLMVLNYPAI